MTNAFHVCRQLVLHGQHDLDVKAVRQNGYMCLKCIGQGREIQAHLNVHMPDERDCAAQAGAEAALLRCDVTPSASGSAYLVHKAMGDFQIVPREIWRPRARGSAPQKQDAEVGVYMREMCRIQNKTGPILQAGLYNVALHNELPSVK